MLFGATHWPGLEISRPMAEQEVQFHQQCQAMEDGGSGFSLEKVPRMHSNGRDRLGRSGEILSASTVRKDV